MCQLCGRAVAVFASGSHHTAGRQAEAVALSRGWFDIKMLGFAVQDAVVARQYITEPETFAATARTWTQSFASQAQADAPDAKVRLHQLSSWAQ